MPNLYYLEDLRCGTHVATPSGVHARLVAKNMGSATVEITRPKSIHGRTFTARERTTWALRAQVHKAHELRGRKEV